MSSDTEIEFSQIECQEFCVKVADGTHESPKQTQVGKRLATSKNIKEGQLNLDSAYLISLADFEDINRRSKVEQWDILISMIGTVGEVCLVNTPFPDFAIKNVGLLKCKEKVHAKWLYYFFRSSIGKQLIEERKKGTTQQYISLGEIRRLPVPIPSQTAYMKYATEILSALDDRIALLRETNATLEAIAQALFKSWFVDFDPIHAKQQGVAPEGLSEATAALFPDGFELSELGMVPRGWKVASLATLMDIAGGTQPPANEFIEHAKEGYIRLIQIRDYETDAHLTYVPHTSKLRTTSKDDVMIARYGASVGRICWGLEGAYNVALVRVVCKSIHREFLRTYLLSDIFQTRLEAVSTRSAQAGFNKEDIASFKLVVASDELLGEYQKISWSLRDKVLHNKQEARTLANLRDTLLPRMISGQLRLPELEETLEIAA